MITVSAFSHVPDIAKGLVRDLRVRWALEEARLPYKVRLLAQGDQDEPEYRALQPFGQVPIFEENGLVLFESGAIVLHIAERSEVLLPTEPTARANAVQWLVAALNSVEPSVWNVFVINNIYPKEEWARLRLPSAIEFMNKKLNALAKRIGNKAFLDGDRFTAGDLMMATVLRFHSDTSKLDPRLVGYLDRCTSRPAFKRALDAQLADFRSAAA
ncbi:MAG: glutathione S-transferase family protein [Proteobacteria bacterium]|nr:glutathione S-transferase family protein [Pseudomonadota bacterium]